MAKCVLSILEIILATMGNVECSLHTETEYFVHIGLVCMVLLKSDVNSSNR